MFNASKDIDQRVSAYANARRMKLEHQLGFGKDGVVFSTNIRTAVKAFEHQATFEREHACYLRLREGGVDEILGHHVPQIRFADADLWIIEMTIVQPPFLLDFASAYLDWPPDFSPEVLAERDEARREQFGTHWPQVEILLGELERRFGIYLLDVHPGNIMFGEGD